MGSLCSAHDSNDDYDDHKERNTQTNGSVKAIASNSYHIALNEICRPETEFQYSVIECGRSQSGSFTSIDTCINYECKDLYEAGKDGARITDTSMIVNKSGNFYVLVHRFKTTSDNNIEIQKYRISDNNNVNDSSSSGSPVGIKFMETVAKDLFKGENVNGEGLEVVLDDEGKEVGLLMCNDLWCTPKTNSNLYFISFAKNCDTSILFSMNDEGIGEWNGIHYYENVESKKDGYLILPQSLSLAKYLNGVDMDWKPFYEWIKMNSTQEYAPFMLFFDRSQVLKRINGNDVDVDLDVAPALSYEKVFIRLSEEAFKNESSMFGKYQQSNGYKCEGFEALSIDENDDILFSLEYANENKISELMPRGETFNILTVGKIACNQESGLLEICIDTNVFKVIENNHKDTTKGFNFAQEALLYYNPNLKGT